MGQSVAPSLWIRLLIAVGAIGAVISIWSGIVFLGRAPQTTAEFGLAQSFNLAGVLCLVIGIALVGACIVGVRLAMAKHG